LSEKKSDKVFIMLGSCDTLMPVDDPKRLFRNDLTKLINKIKEELPDSSATGCEGATGDGSPLVVLFDKRYNMVTKQRTG